MAWELLRTDYVDAVFEGLRRYLVSENGDGSVSFHDITNYAVREGAFFGAKDANAINTAVNAILAALENGTDLYEVFMQFFEAQKALFLAESDAKQDGFEAYIANLRQYMDGKWDELKVEYTGDIQYFKDVQENAFNVWFQMVRDQLTNDVAGHLQTQIGNLELLETEEKDDLVSAVNSIHMSYNETLAVLADARTLTVNLAVCDGSAVPPEAIVILDMTNADGRQTEMERKEPTDGIVVFEVFEGMKYIIRATGHVNSYYPNSPTVIVDGDMDVEVLYKPSPNLGSLTWEEIYAISANGRMGECFLVGDGKTIELTTGENVFAQIVGLGQDIPAGNTGNATLATFIIRDYLATKYRMNPTNTNRGGWKDSEMRTKYIKENFYDVLPEQLRACIRPVLKKTSAGNAGASIVTTEDHVWLPSAVELGVTDIGDVYMQEGTAYSAFSGTQNEAARKRLKASTAGGVYGSYWLRSPDASNTTKFKMIIADTKNYGVDSADYASAGAGMAVGFCL